MADLEAWAKTLEAAIAHHRKVRDQPGRASLALGFREWDAGLWRMGRKHLLSSSTYPPVEAPDGPDVYLASQLYQDGGHTALIGDFVRALDAADGSSPSVILTNLEGHNAAPLSEAIRARLNVAPERVLFLEGTSAAERLQHLFAQLLALRPRRLFFFHHPGDPLPCVVAHPEIAGQCVLVHHSDSAPSFGLHLPDVRIIDLNPVAAAMTRLQSLDPALLLLTTPDPGPRPHGFLRRGRLVTASSGSMHKFTGRHAYDYPSTVGIILRSTGGWHVHIGPLSAELQTWISVALERDKVPADRFVHVPSVPSVAKALWEHDCDVYFSSFPVDGARTNVDVMASGTPHLRHSTRPMQESSRSEFSLDGGMVWRSWTDLANRLKELNDASLLEERSARLRRSYERLHHPEVFARELKGILAGGAGVEDPDRSARDYRAAQLILRAFTADI